MYSTVRIHTGNPIEKLNPKKVQIRKSVKLLEQILRYERNDGILRCSDLIVGIVSVRMRFGPNLM